ncbi:MAG: DUF2148 domain-containing protein [Pseudomonadota bacterium]
MEGLEVIAKLMVVAAKTAPKGFGKDYLDIQIISEEGIPPLAEEMKKCGEETGRSGFFLDAHSIEESSLVVLIGLKEAPPAGLDCCACGFDTCKEMESHESIGKFFKGPQCVVRLTDLGIAVGSAVSTAAFHHADNRVMLNIGVAARRLKMSEANYILGIPLSDTAKNPYFDRKK